MSESIIVLKRIINRTVSMTNKKTVALNNSLVAFRMI